MTAVQHAADAIQSLREATAKHLRQAELDGQQHLQQHYGGQLAGLDLALLILSWEHTNNLEVTK